MPMPPGNHLDPVDSSLYVFRLARPSKDFEEKKSILPISLDTFVLTTDDKKGTPPHLSVWVEGFTTPLEAYAFLKPESPNKIICWLKVGDIRNISNLVNVLWINIQNSQTGADGHAGITGLDQGDKLQRKSLRSKLVDIANANATDSSRIHMVEI